MVKPDHLSPLEARLLRQRIAEHTYLLPDIEKNEEWGELNQQLEALLADLQLAPLAHTFSSLTQMPPLNQVEIISIIQQTGQRFWEEVWWKYALVGSAWRRLQGFGKVLSATGSGYSYPGLNPIREINTILGKVVRDWWDA